MGKEARCPYCLDDLVGKERVVRCVSCRTPHHAVCFDEHGGCVAFGCGGLGKADAGQSIMLPRPILELGARWREVPLVPLRGKSVRFRPAKRVPAEEQADGPIGPWVRLSIEQEKLHYNQDLKARVVVAVMRDTVVRRLEVRIFDEPLDDEHGEDEPRLLTARILGRPPFAMGSLMRSMVGFAAPYPRLRPGMHPYQVEIPRLFGGLIARGERRLVQVGVVLERVGSQTVASPRVTVELVAPSAREPEPALARSSNAVGDPANAVILHGGTNLLAEARGARAVWFDAPPEPARAHERIVPIAAPPFPDDLALARIDHVERRDPPRPAVDTDDLIGSPTESTDDGTRRDGPPPPAALPPELVPFAATPQPSPAAPPAPFGVDAVADALEAALAAVAQPKPAPAPVQDAPEPRPAILVRPRDSRRAPRLDAPPQAPPRTPPPAGPTNDGWTIFAFRAMTTAGPRTGRVLRARFAPRDDLPPLRLSLEIPPRKDEDGPGVIDFTIDSPHALESVDLACRYEVLDKTGAELAAGDFPLLEEVTLVGERALDAARTGHEKVSVSMAVDPFLLDAARALRLPGHAAPAELVLRLACEAIDTRGDKATSGTRVAKVPLKATGSGSGAL